MGRVNLERILHDAGLRIERLGLLKYNRRKQDFEIEEHVFLGYEDKDLAKKIEQLSRNGAIFKGEFTQLPKLRKSKLYDEAMRKAQKWYEIYCDKCERFIDLFKIYVCEEDNGVHCVHCAEDSPYNSELGETNDKLLAKAIEKHRPLYKVSDNVVLVYLEGRKKYDFILKNRPLSMRAIRQFGRLVK